VLTAESRLNEPTVAFVLANMLPRGHGLFLGNSMPVRDMDRYGFWPTERNITVGANRGASGIDGLIASAVGFAQGLGEPTTLLIGDLSTLHDLNSLAMLKRADPPVIVVIVNNHGGAIFDLLPVAGQTQHYERFFATPHDLSFSSAAKMFSVAYQNVGNVDEFRSAYATAAQSGKSTILELVTDRKLNQQLRRKIQQRLSTRES